MDAYNFPRELLQKIKRVPLENVTGLFGYPLIKLLGPQVFF